jgi:hypothetical protein
MPRPTRDDQTNKPIRVYRITPQWAFTVLAGAIITGAVGGAFSAYRVLNTDHFTLSTLATAFDKHVEESDDLFVRKDVLGERLVGIEKQLETLNKNVEKLSGKLDNHINYSITP